MDMSLHSAPHCLRASGAQSTRALPTASRPARRRVSASACSRIGPRWIACWPKASGDIEAFRASEMVAFMEGMSQTMVQGIFYGNAAVTPASFNGLSVFYNTVATSTAQNAANVIGRRRHRQLQPVHLVELLQPSLALLRVLLATLRRASLLRICLTASAATTRWAIPSWRIPSGSAT